MPSNVCVPLFRKKLPFKFITPWLCHISINAARYGTFWVASWVISSKKMQIRAARVITKLLFATNSNHLLTTLNWERLAIRRKKRKALMMYKTMNGHAPDYLQRLFTQYYSNYNLRNSEGKLASPKPRTNYLKRGFSYSGATLWNNLPSSLKNVGSVDRFKRNLKNVSSISDSHTAIM